MRQPASCLPITLSNMKKVHPADLIQHPAVLASWEPARPDILEQALKPTTEAPGWHGNRLSGKL